MFEETKEPLLAALSRSGVPNIQSCMRVVRVASGATLQLDEATPRFAHIVRIGAISRALCVAGQEAAAIRICTAGDVLEANLLVGGLAPSYRIAALLPSEVIRVPFAMLKQAFESNETVRHRILVTHSMQAVEVEQLSVCNRMHQLEARLARYLLTLYDRCGDATIPMTQEGLASELGARRSSVTVAAGSMRQNKVIALRRSRIQVLDRSALENAACDCYNTISRVRAGLLERLSAAA